MEIRHLGHTDIETIIECFNAAFADYLIPFHVEVEPMKKRWRSCRVDYKLSYGAFDRGQLVGFMITGVDQWKGQKTAYNSGTGVIPDYRGRRIVKQMYELALPEFRRQDIKQCTLEVIVGNDRAIKAYTRSGFASDRRLQCFVRTADVLLPTEKRYRIKRADVPDWDQYRTLLEFQPSWESGRAAYELLRADCAIWELYSEHRLVGFIILKPGSGHVLQFGVADRPDWKLIGRSLWIHALESHVDLRINNVDSRAERSLAILRDIGMEHTLDQWEMIMEI